MALLMPLLSVVTASASDFVGKDPFATSCANDRRQIWARSEEVSQDGGFIVRDKTRALAGWVYVYHSDACRTAWAEWYSNTATHWFHGELSLWNSWNQNQKKSTSAGETWGRTAMVDDPPGVTTCVGMQVYYNGEWRRWHFGFCYS
jgi:Protein of unknown function (DUF2690)